MIPHELRLILKDLVAHKKKLIVVALTGIFSAAAKSSLPILVGLMMDSASGAMNSQNSQKLLKFLADSSMTIQPLVFVALVALGIQILGALSRYTHIYSMNIIAERTSQNLREKLQNKFVHLDLKFHNKYVSGSGGLLSRTFNDVRIIQDGLRLFADLFSAPLTFIAMLTILFFLDYKLTLYILIAAPILGFLLKFISKGIRKYSLMGVEQLEKITSTVKESLDGVRTIQSFLLQDILRLRLRKEGEDFLNMRKKIHKRVEFMGPFTETLAAFIIVGIMFYFSKNIANGTTTVGTLMGFITAMLQINEPIKKFQEAYVRVQETRVSAVRVYSMVEEQSTIKEIESPEVIPQHWNTIEYRNVNFSYEQGQTLLANFNLKINRGQTVAFVGESGSGKSTIANLLARFYDAQSGDILIDRVNIKNLSINNLRKNISLVSQDVFLFSDSVEKNIQAGSPDYNFDKIVNSAKAAYAHDFISRLPNQYKTSVGERGNLLSGGEKQRVAIARALYKDAPILILDEATSALDSVSEEQVQNGLEVLMKGRTTLVIAHRLSTIQNADLILVLKKGQIVEQGKHAELLAGGGEYARLFYTQTKTS